MEISIKYSKELFKMAVMKFTLRKLRFYFVFMLLIIVFCVIWLLLYWPLLWTQIYLVLLPIMLLVAPLLVYWWTLNNCLMLLKKMSNPFITLQFNDENVSVKIDSADSNIQWKLFHQLWRFDTVWLLFLSPVSFYILPIEKLDEELQELIVKKCKDNNIKVL